MIRRTARVPWSRKDASASDAGAILATVSAPSESAVKGRLNLSERVRVRVGCGDVGSQSIYSTFNVQRSTASNDDERTSSPAHGISGSSEFELRRSATISSERPLGIQHPVPTPSYKVEACRGRDYRVTQWQFPEYLSGYPAFYRAIGYSHPHL
jgi:hypothetical protein